MIRAARHIIFQEICLGSINIAPWLGQGACLTHRIAIPVDTARVVAIYMDPLSSDDKSSMVILEGNWIRIVSPIIQIIGQLKQNCVNESIIHVRYEK